MHCPVVNIKVTTGNTVIAFDGTKSDRSSEGN